MGARLRSVTASLLLAVAVVVVSPALAWAQTCVQQTDDGIPGWQTLSVDCPADEPPVAVSPIGPDGKVPSAADGELLTGTFYFLRKPPTLLRDGIPSPCAAVVTVAPNSMIYHGTRDTPGNINPNDAFFSMPASAVAINGEPCTAPANVTIRTWYYEDGDARVSLEARANFETLICGNWGAVSLEWFVVPSRRIAWLSFQKLVCDQSDWSCQDESLWFDLSLQRRYECEMTRSLCRGGVLNYTGPPQTVR